MASRLKLHEEFCEILGTREVYFQPPESRKMQYPCIRYKLSAPNVKRADNCIYLSIDKYEVTVIDYDPESTIPDTIVARFAYASIDRRYTADNLNHTVLTLYY